MNARTLACLGALTLTLGACSNQAEAIPSETSPASASVPDHCSDPLAGKPAKINARELAFCQAEALGKIAGYVQEDTLDGTLSSRSRVNMDPLAVEIQSFSQSGDPIGRVILVSGNTFVEREGSWIQAKADSDDDALAYQATLPKRFEALLNPHVRAAGTDPSLEYSVVGTETIDSTPVTVLSLEVTNDSDRLVSKLYIRDDYVVLQSESTYTVNGTQRVRGSKVSEIDQPQDIINPRFEDDAHRSGIDPSGRGGEPAPTTGT
ncbi:hypothetical protein INS90_00215 [Trueperella pecoris]|uniref:Lipoprotein n=1 Tax=Trueperella pecoris TaxID=2733571 RepID=A0A7M1R2R5_9ACTO|nr:hypothetical protein [Trueperella pecoris]QOR47777.1 hypothetical protein INS90_00215 [Trueperella pecoris]